MALVNTNLSWVFLRSEFLMRSSYALLGSNMFERLKNLSCKIIWCISKLLAHWATIGTLIIVIFSYCLAEQQLLLLLKDQRQWQNFNEMNVRYANLLSKMPEKISSDNHSIDSKDQEIKIWVRQYFDLYSEKHWLYKKQLIPEEMWKCRVRPGVVVNLKAYPILVNGYNYWKDQGAFNHPDDFHKVVEEDINKAKIKDLQDKPQYHCAESKPKQNNIRSFIFCFQCQK